MTLENKHRGNGKVVYKGTARQEKTKRHCKRSYWAQLTTLSLSHPYATEDRTEPYLAKPSKGSCQGLRGEQALGVQESALFLKGSLDKGLYYGHKGKGHVTEVVTTAEKLPLDDLEDVKDTRAYCQQQERRSSRKSPRTCRKSQKQRRPRKGRKQLQRTS
jgi:hypothetical protein